MLFSEWATVCEAVAATTKKLQKAALLRAFFERLADDDLVLAARFFAGAPFPLADQRVLNVGYAVIRDAVERLTAVERDEWQRLVVAEGEPGRAAQLLLPGHVAATASLTLGDVLAIYESLQAARGPTRKLPLIVDSLRRMTPLEGTYFIKLMMGGDLRIGLQEGLVEDSLARAFGAPIGEVQRANMLLGDIGETALLARHGRLATASMRLFHPLKFMLASPIEEPAEIRKSIPGAFFVEDKYDGIRAQIHKSGDRIAMYSRTLDDIGHRFPELHAPLLALPGEWIVDGEVLAAVAGRILPFKALQTRIGRKDVSDDLLASTPAILVAYDLLYQDGEVLLDEPFVARRERLERLLRPFGTAAADGTVPGPVCASFAALADDIAVVDAMFEGARARGNEGLMVKDPQARYKPGRRGHEWLKVKKALATLDVVVTAAEVGNGNRRKFLSDYTFAVRRSADDGELLNVGKAYSGLTDVEVAELTEWFRAHTLRDFGRVRLVEPEIVLEVAFDVVQPSARHKSGYALRFPRIVRWRKDKPPAEIDTLDAVRRLAGE